MLKPVILVLPVILCGIMAIYVVPCSATISMLTENASLLRPGDVEAEIGAGYFRYKDIPRGDLPLGPTVDISVYNTEISKYQVRGPILGFRFGLSRYAEFYINWPAYIFQNDDIMGDEADVGDVEIFTKLRLLREGKKQPAASFQVGTKLPNTSNESGLGTDETDFFASMLFSKWIGKCTFHFNGGIAILSDPGMESRQKDSFIYSAGFIYHTLKKNVFIEVHKGLGIVPFETPTLLRAGFVYKKMAWSFDAAVSTTLSGTGEDVGIMCGLTYAFRLFDQ